MDPINVTQATGRTGSRGRLIALGVVLVGATAVNAYVRVSDDFTWLHFLDKFGQALVVEAVFLPLAFVVRGLLRSREHGSGDS